MTRAKERSGKQSRNVNLEFFGRINKQCCHPGIKLGTFPSYYYLVVLRYNTEVHTFNNTVKFLLNQSDPS